MKCWFVVTQVLLINWSWLIGEKFGLPGLNHEIDLFIFSFALIKMEKFFLELVAIKQGLSDQQYFGSHLSEL